MMLASHAIAFFSSILMAFVTIFPVFGTLMNLTGVLLVDHYIDTIDVYLQQTIQDANADGEATEIPE